MANATKGEGMKRFRFGRKSWVWRAVSLLVLATFPFWWIVLWRDERRHGGKGFWAAGWLLLASAVTNVMTGED